MRNVDWNIIFLFCINMAPVDSSPVGVAKLPSFQLISSGVANDLIPVKKYRSTRTGLTVVIADVESPVVNGYFCLVTEAHDDDGLPHTLEHLVFLGSEKYPYKGVLDLVANRCLASGTNAWTDTDHTCYTMTTVGSQGFLGLMPIYIDHILFPILNDSGYVTEVHHIDGEGQDAGVIYCEVQGTENTGESLCHTAMVRKLYPNNPYSADTGGRLHNIRTSLSNSKIRAFHKEFYRSENLTLIIAGKVHSQEVFEALDELENKIVAQGPRESFSRPFQTPVAPLAASVDELQPYPSDEEENGMVYVSWRGPSAVHELYKLGACSVMLKYLTDTAVSPLQRDFVEIKDPYASNVNFSIIENSVAALYMMFENVPVAKLDLVKDHLRGVLGKIIDGKEALDMGRLHTVINRQTLESLSHLETMPHDTVAFMIIGDMLYGHTKEDLEQRLNSVRDFHRMLEEPTSFWLDLLQNYFGADVPCVVVRGRPSVKLQEKMMEDERKRIQAQRDSLKADGLEKKERILMQAIAHNDIPPPVEMITSVPIPSTKGINFHSIESFTAAHPEVSHPAFPDLSVAGVMMHLDHLHTNFVYMFVLLDTSSLEEELRPYLPLLLETLLESPIQRGDELVPYEVVVSELEADTISASTRIGLEATSRFSCGPFGQTAVLGLQVEQGKYAKGVHWLQELLMHTRLTTERVQLIAAKIANDVSQAKRQGNAVSKSLIKGILYKKGSNQYYSSMIRQHIALTELMTTLESGGSNAQRIIDRMEKLRTHLIEPSRMTVHLCANLDTLEDPVSPWNNFLPSHIQPNIAPLTIIPDYTLLRETNNDRACALGLGCIESSFLQHCCPGPKGFLHEDLAPVLVFLQYLTQLEGPLWKQVRGPGLTYGYNMFPNPNEGMLYFSLYRSTNVLAAFKQSKSIVEAQMKEGAEWDQALFDSARSSLVFEVVEREKSVGDVVAQSLLSYFKGVTHDYNKEMVKRILNVTMADLKRVGPKYIAPLFNPGSSFTAIVCHPSSAEEIAAAFNQMGFKMKVSLNLEGSPLGC